ncbi:MAG: protein kinase domain-containing protein [Thermoguttaceae bacterium]
MVDVYAADEIEGVPYLIMQLFEVSLEGWLKQHGSPFTERLSPLSGKAWRSQRADRIRFVRNLRNLAKTMDRIHKSGLMHLDLKPSNILIDGKGDWHLGDFSLARFMQPRAAESEEAACVRYVGGTPECMAPEQAQGCELDRRADIFGLGGILYRALTGQPPRPRQEGVDIRDATTIPIRAPQELVGATDSRLAEIAMICLSLGQEDRYENAEGVVKALDGWLKAKELWTTAFDLLRWTASEMLMWAGAAARLFLMIPICVCVIIIRITRSFIGYCLIIVISYDIFADIITGLLRVLDVMLSSRTADIVSPVFQFEHALPVLLVATFAWFGYEWVKNLVRRYWADASERDLARSGQDLAHRQGFRYADSESYGKFAAAAKCDLKCKSGSFLGLKPETGEFPELREVVEGRFEIKDGEGLKLHWILPNSPRGEKFFSGVFDRGFVPESLHVRFEHHDRLFVVVVPLASVETFVIAGNLVDEGHLAGAFRLQSHPGWYALLKPEAVAFWTEDNVDDFLSLPAFWAKHGPGYEAKLKQAIAAYWAWMRVPGSTEAVQALRDDASR